MTFTRPEALLLLLLLLPVLFWSRHFWSRQAGGSATLARGATVLRLLVLALVVAAFARPVLEYGDEPVFRVVVADLSDSCGSFDAVQAAVDRAISEADDGETVRLVSVAATARQETPRPRSTREFAPLTRDGRRTDRSRLADGLRLALDLVPFEASGAVVLISDGRATRDAIRPLAARFAAREVALDVRTVGAAAPRPTLSPPRVPAQAPVGTVVSIPIEVEAPHDGVFEVRIRGEEPKTPERTAKVTVAGGKGAIELPHEVEAVGLNRWRVVLHGLAGEEIPGADAQLAVFGLPPRRVWLVESREGPSAAGAVRGLLGHGATVRPVEAESLTGAEDLASVDYLILSDVPAASLAPAAQVALSKAAENGLGVLVAGGERSFGPGGYAKTPLETMLPVRFQQKEERRDPSATLVIIIDTSGSMSGARIQLAKETARLAMRRLKPHDKAGIVEFHGAKRWAAAIQPASNGVDLLRALNRLNAGGGTVILPAIEEAYYGLLNVRTRTRHVLVLTDGGVEQGAFEPLIRKMADKGMTLSTVLVGPGTHSGFLVSLAQWGRGRYYHAPDRFNMPEVIVKQPESSLLSPAIEEPTAIRAIGDSFVAREVSVPESLKLHGLLEVRARPTAEVRLETGRGEPLLAGWRFGLGRVSAWMSDLSGPWSRELSGWEGYARLVTGLFREGARARYPGRVSLRTSHHLGRLAVFAWRDPGTDADGPLEVRVSTEDGAPSNYRHAVTLMPADGSGMDAPVAALFDGVPPGLVRIEAKDEQGRVVSRGATVVPPEREWVRAKPDREALATAAGIAGGLMDASLSTVAARGRAEGAPLWRHLLALALAVFLLQVFARRRSRRTAMAGLLIALVVGGGNAVAQDQGADELPPAVVQHLELATRAGPDTAEGRKALADAVRAVRLADGRLDTLLVALEKRAANDANAVRLLARVASVDGRPGRALELLERLDREQRLDGNGLAEYARLLEAVGREEDALAALDRAIAALEAPATRVALAIRKASLLLSRGKEAGLEPLRQLLRDHPDQPDLEFYVALLAGLHGRADFFRSFEARDTSPKVRYRDHLIAGTFALRAKNHARAQHHFLGALESARLDRDRRYAQERLIAAHRAAGTLGELCDRWLAEPQRTAVRVDALVAVLRELRRPEEALELLLAGKGMGAEAAKKERPFRSLQREIIGLALECNRPSEVEGTYKALIARHPTRTQWRSGLALLYLLRGERDRAAEVFRAGIRAAGSDGKAVMRLAGAARDLSLEPVARGAADHALKLDRDTQLRAHLFLVEMDRKAGRTEEATARLKVVEKSFQDHDEALAQVSDAYERMRRLEDSIRVLTVIEKRSPMEDVLMRLAWLHQERRETERALELWRSLWKTTQLPARIRQAEDRLLDLSSNTGRLADLAIDLEEKLEAGKGNARDLALLTKLYMRANDPVSAIEVLKMYGGSMGKNQLETLQAMAHVYQHCMDYRRYEATLHRLQELDPENKIDYQQQLALGALERGRGRQAKRVLSRLQKIAPDDVMAEEFAAGVLAMVGLLDDSVRAYTRVVAGHPDRIEDYLLLANVMRDDERRSQAVRMFLDLLESAEKDDLFTVAVDGLLNLSAERPMLRVAQRRVKERIAQRPQKAFLYQLAADLAEELGEPDEQVAMTSLMVIVAGERRSSVLRELMDLESARQRFEDLIDYGRSVLALGEEMPPQVFLDLGRALIRIGDLTTAERVFARTRIAGDFASMQRRIAGFYADAGHVRDAGRILRQALLARPDDVDLLTDVGALAEVAGERDQARRDFARAYDVLIRRSPAAIGAPRKKTGEKKPSTQSTRVTSGTSITILPGGGRVVRSISSVSSFSRNRNVDDYQRFGQAAEGGLLANTMPPGDTLLADLESRITAELAALDQEDAFRDQLRNNPRLARLHTLARRAAFLYDRPEIAERIDRLVLDRYPDDKGMRDAAVRVRLQRGLARSAEKLAAAFKLDVAGKFRALYLEQLLRKDGAVDKVIKSGLVDASRAVSVLPNLFQVGRTDEARKVFEAVDPDAGKVAANVARSLAVTAIAFDDRARFERWSELWFEQALRTSNPRGLAGALGGWFQVAWGRIDAAARDRAWERIIALEARAKDKRKTALTGFLYRMGGRIGKPVKVEYELFEQMLEQASKSFHGMRPVLQLAPPEFRSRLLQKALTRLPDRGRRNQMMSFVTTLTFALDEAAVDGFARAFRDAANDRNYPVTAYYYQVARLVATPHNAELARKMVRVLRKEFSDENVFDLAEGILDVKCGREAAGVKRVADTLKAIAARGKFENYEQNLINQLFYSNETRILAVLKQAIVELGEQRSPMRVLIEARLAAHEGRRADEVRMLAEVYAKDPDNREVRSAYLSALRALGRLREVAEAEQRWLQGQVADNTYAYRSLAESFRRLARPIDALDAVRKVAPQRYRPAVDPLEIYLLDQLERDDAVRGALRRMIASSRKQRSFFSARWPQPLSRGGLQGTASRGVGVAVPFGIVHFGRGGSVRDSLYWNLADRSWAAEEFACIRRGRVEGNLTLDDPILVSLARALDHQWGRERTESFLAARIGRGELNQLDYALVALVTDHGTKPLPAALADLEALRRSHAMVRGRAAGGDTGGLAARCVREGRIDAARTLYRWLLGRQLSQSRIHFGSAASKLTDLLAEYLATYPEAERSDRCRALLESNAGLLLAGTGQNLDRLIFFFDAWQKVGDEAALSVWVGRVKEALANTPEHMAYSPAAQQLRGRLALLFAGRGDRDAFRDAVKAMCGTNAHTRRSVGFSVRSVLPQPEAAKDPAALAVVVDEALDGVLTGDRMRSARLGLVGWLAKAGAGEAASRMLERLLPFEHGTAAQRLVLADTARRVGRDDVAFAVEKALFEESALNVLRIPDLIAAIEKHEDAAAADAVAIRAAAYTDHPPVLVRAIETTLRSGDREAAVALVKRLAAVRPGHTALAELQRKSAAP